MVYIINFILQYSFLSMNSKCLRECKAVFFFFVFFCMFKIIHYNHRCGQSYTRLSITLLFSCGLFVIQKEIRLRPFVPLG